MTRPWTFVGENFQRGWAPFANRIALVKVCLLCGAVMRYGERADCDACGDVPATSMECLEAWDGFRA